MSATDLTTLDKRLGLVQILNRHVPDMDRGFCIATTYGDLRVDPGQLADRIRDLLSQHARLELMRLDASEQLDQEQNA